MSAQIFDIRSSLYELLSVSTYREPSVDTLKELQKRLTALKQLSSLWPEKVLWSQVQDLLESIFQENTEELAVDYAGLFLSGRDGSICPSESSYLDRMVYGPRTIQVMDLYAKDGFIKENSFTEPDDHIAVECAFMGLLGNKLAATISDEGLDSDEARDSLERQITFLTEHFLKWVPIWADQVEKRAEASFYRAVARLARTLAESDQRFLMKVLHREG
jgi:TorA maturation chaperone TorD